MGEMTLQIGSYSYSQLTKDVLESVKLYPGCGSRILDKCVIPVAKAEPRLLFTM
jgi:hypothetical protein